MRGKKGLRESSATRSEVFNNVGMDSGGDRPDTVAIVQVRERDMPACWTGSVLEPSGIYPALTIGEPQWGKPPHGKARRGAPPQGGSHISRANLFQADLQAAPWRSWI